MHYESCLENVPLLENIYLHVTHIFLKFFHLIFFQFKFSFRRSIQFIFLRQREIRNFSFLIHRSKIKIVMFCMELSIHIIS